MIYFQSKDQKHVVILELSALEALRAGNALISPDNLVFVAVTPDIDWTAEQFQKEFVGESKQLTAERMKAILAEGLTRPEKKSVLEK